MRKLLAMTVAASLIISSAVYAADTTTPATATGVDGITTATTTTPAPTPVKSPAAKTPATSKVASKLSRMLGLGSNGDDVKLLQTLLNNNGYKLVADGFFGKGTLDAVKEYQSKNGMKADGIVGPMTFEKLNPVAVNDYSGTYIGYSWADEAKGVALKDTKKKIQTILELDKDGTIIDASVLSFKKVDGFWVLRQSGNATVSVDFSVEPTKATPDVYAKYVAGNSMFTVKTGADDLMSFYTVAVDKDGTTAVLIADPITRYLFEMKFKPGYDFSTKVGALTIDSGQLVPTVLTEDGGIKIKDWSEF